jgi:hypothetical protein
MSDEMGGGAPFDDVHAAMIPVSDQSNNQVFTVHK